MPVIGILTMDPHGCRIRIFSLWTHEEDSPSSEVLYLLRTVVIPGTNTLCRGSELYTVVEKN